MKLYQYGNQIIVTELNPMSDAPEPVEGDRFSEKFIAYFEFQDGIHPLVVFKDEEGDLMGWFGKVETESCEAKGWLPMPVYEHNVIR